MGILQTTLRRHIKFDPANAHHRAAYWQLRKTGRQDDDLRFVLEEGYSNILSMMQVKIADHFSQPWVKEEEVARVVKIERKK